LPTMHTRSYDRFEVFLRQLHEESVAASPAPSITFDAAKKPLAVVIDLDQPDTAEGAIIIVGPFLHSIMSAKA
jgi:hypothetical protein